MMRDFMNIVAELQSGMMAVTEHDLAIAESDARFKVVVDCMADLRAANQEQEFASPERVQEIRRIMDEMSRAMFGLEHDYDVPAELIRLRAVQVIRQRDN